LSIVAKLELKYTGKNSSFIMQIASIKLSNNSGCISNFTNQPPFASTPLSALPLNSKAYAFGIKFLK
jgi:hypothetical protein